MGNVRRAKEQRRMVWPPEPGLFCLRLVRDGWRVPAKIVHDEEGRWHAEVDEEVHESHPDPAHAYMVSAIWHAGLKLPQADYDWLLAIKRHAQKHDPTHPSLNPRRSITPMWLRPLETTP